MRKKGEGMIKYIHCVFVRHKRQDKTFLFSVDGLKQLKNGTEVLCDTKYGESDGVCVGDSFMVSESALKSIAENIGAYLPLKKVVGTIEMEIVKQKTVKRFDGLPF